MRRVAITGHCAERKKLFGREGYGGLPSSMERCSKGKASKVKNCFTPQTGIPHLSTSQVKNMRYSDSILGDAGFDSFQRRTSGAGMAQC